MSILLTAALDYATAFRWRVFPCRQYSKEPATRRGFYDASSNPETIRRLWSAGDLNIGIATGAVSGFWVLDVDGAEGAESLTQLEARLGSLPATRTAITANGCHLLFTYTIPLQSTASRIGPGLDVRADKGFIVGAPSRHPTGHVYAWRDPTCPIATAPDWLIEHAARRRGDELVTPAEPPRRVDHPEDDRYGRAALEAEIERLRAAAPGGRNEALNRAAYRLAQLAAGGELAPGGITELLIEACHANGLVKDDGLVSVRKTIKSGADAGLKRPRGRR